jgi:hypothetical protein
LYYVVLYDVCNYYKHSSGTRSIIFVYAEYPNTLIASCTPTYIYIQAHICTHTYTHINALLPMHPIEYAYFKLRSQMSIKCKSESAFTWRGCPLKWMYQRHVRLKFRAESIHMRDLYTRMKQFWSSWRTPSINVLNI